jgi:hypothetical protein
MYMGTQACQIVGMLILSLLFTSKDSEYYEISFKNKTLLPTGF